MQKWLIILLALISVSSFAQKKSLTPDNYGTWNRIKDVSISPKGNTVIYTLSGETSNKSLHIYDANKNETYSVDRVSDPNIDYSGNAVMYLSVADVDTVREMKRRKVDKADMPKDSLSIFYLNQSKIAQVYPVKNYQVPTKYGGYVAYLLTPKGSKKDSTILSELDREESKENGSRLIVRNINTEKEDTLYFVRDYRFSEGTQQLVYHTSGKDSTQLDAGVYTYDLLSGKSKLVHASKGDIYHMDYNEAGNMLSFTEDADTTERRRRPYSVYHWKQGMSKAMQITTASNSAFLKDHWVSNNTGPWYSEDDQRLYFATAPAPILQDSLALDDEIVNVEVWHYQDGRLYTQQNVRANRTRNKDYRCYYDLKTKKIVPLASADIPSVQVGNEGNARYGLGIDDQDHLKYISWLGYPYRDLYKIDMNTGSSKLIQEKIQGYPFVSTSGRYFTWYDREQKKHYGYDLEKEKRYTLTTEAKGTFYDEKNDRPMAPYEYGTPGWTLNDKLLIYDRYDIWMVSPDQAESLRKITNGRKDKTQYRIITLDDELDYIPSNIMIRWFNEDTRQEGYGRLDINTGKIQTLIEGDFKLDTRPIKATDADALLYTKETYDIFPDLILADTLCQQSRTISEANPQQKDYKWGSIQIHKWKDSQGVEREGLLVLPEDFDANKKYPLLVNFYELNSHRLHNHRAPYAHRSTINYVYYASKGYVLFNPDIHYEIGYPGKSCEIAVMSGVQSVIDKGFIDKDRVGVQGHSWGGYQVAHLLTKTDMFACAESGAPVVNMVSAYGGIRWGSGMSRMFQYEQTQSRLGATLWERPDLYLENSPVFNLDKVNTPVLILHNDEDGAVPWYQGIEYFVGLRRLGKPSWMLNYNGEPHWPVKWQNRLDFNIRMEQFFDHYLMNQPMPKWMKQGVPAVEKGIRQGLELDRN